MGSVASIILELQNILNEYQNYYSSDGLLQIRFTLSYKDVEEIMKMLGIAVDHALIQCWVFKFAPLIESEIKMRKNNVGSS